MKTCVIQLGARMHYAVPRIFNGAGKLHALFTDICGTSGAGRLLAAFPKGVLPQGARRLAARQVNGIPKEKLVTFDRVGLAYWWNLKTARTRRDIALAHLRAGEALGKAVIRYGVGDADTIYTFNSAGLDILKFARERGIRTVHEQTIAPVAVQTPLLKEEYSRWQGWEEVADDKEFFRPFLDNEMREWALADTILCGSDFVRQGISQVGGPIERAVVVPYGVDMKVDPSVLERRDAEIARPLRVLTVGTVCLRKGAPYVMEIAKRLKGRAEFRMAGPIDLTAEGTRNLAAHVNLLGVVPRNEMGAQFAWADVFLLPSICEGSATATYEALAWGLPVVTTPNTGSPVVDGQNGILVSIRDVNGFVEALQRLSEKTIRLNMGNLARSSSTELSVAAYGQRLIEAVQS